MYGTQIPPFYPVLGPAGASNPGWVTTGAQTFAGDKTFTGTTTFNKTAEATTAENIWIAGTSDDSVGKATLLNGVATNNFFVPTLRFDNNTTTVSSVFQARTTTDTGSTALFNWDFQTIGGAAITTRPLFGVTNDGTTVLSGLPLNSGANLALSWGTQATGAPAFTNRANGTRTVWYSNIGAANVDYATGVGGSPVALWHSVPQASSSYAHALYAGTTKVWEARGDGLVTETGGKIAKVRVATTTPVTVAAGTDYKIVTRLAVAGAVAVNLPASPPTGQTFVIQDGTGDAASNNVTITPAAGTINGAATKVISTNYGAVVLEYDGTTWLAR